MCVSVLKALTAQCVKTEWYSVSVLHALYVRVLCESTLCASILGSDHWAKLAIKQPNISPNQYQENVALEQMSN